MPDVTGLFLVASSWLPQWASNIHIGEMFKAGMFLLSCILTILAIIDYSMKISWKLTQRKRSKLRCSSVDECCNLKALKEDYK